MCIFCKILFRVIIEVGGGGGGGGGNCISAQTSMDVRKLLVIHRLHLFWSAKKHLATSVEPRAHILAPLISFIQHIDKNT